MTDGGRRGGEGGARPRLGLLLTCAVDAHPAVASSRRSAAARLMEYQAGIDSWSFFGAVGPIVVCEGSACPEDRFRNGTGANERATSFEYLSYETTEASATRGKGCAELELLSAALAESRSLAGVDRVLKATGRYTVLNGPKLVARLLARADPPDVWVNLHNRLTYADARVFAFSRSFFSERLYPRRHEIRDAPDADGTAVWLEHVLARAALEHAAAGGSWDLLPIPARLRGTSGTTGAPLRGSLPGHLRQRTTHWLKSRALGSGGTGRAGGV